MTSTLRAGASFATLMASPGLILAVAIAFSRRLARLTLGRAGGAAPHTPAK